jgi:hypothetical protein
MGAVVVIWLLCGVVGHSIGSPKGKAGAGVAVGLLLESSGIVIVACMSDSPEVAIRKKPLAVRSHPSGTSSGGFNTSGRRG